MVRTLFWLISITCCLISAAAGQSIQVIPVPMNPNDLSIPHPAYNGHEVTVKAIARAQNDLVYFRCDIDGDGNWDANGTPLLPGNWYSANPYTVEFRAYLPPVDPSISQRKTFLAKLEVAPSDALGNIIPSASVVVSYPIVVFADIPAEHNDTRNPPVNLEPDVINAEAATPAQLKIMTQVAIDDALWWLHKQMSRYGLPSATMTGSLFGSSPSSTTIAGSALFAIALQRNGHMAAYPPNTYNNFGVTPPSTFSAANDLRYSTDPYSEDLTRLLNFLLTQTKQLSGIPSEDESDDGRTPIAGTNDETAYYLYENAQYEMSHQSLALEALALSGLVGTVAQTGPAFIQGKSFEFIVQQLVDYGVYCQNDAGDALGGWMNYPNQTVSANAYISGGWCHALCMVDQYLNADNVIVNNRVKNRIPNMLVRNQLSTGGPQVLNTGTPYPEFETVGHAVLACRWLGWDNWDPSDLTPAGYAPDPSATRGSFRQVYDKYLSYIAQSWETQYAASGMFDPTQVFWSDGDHSSTNSTPRSEYSSNIWTFSLYTNAEAYTYGSSIATIGTHNWYHDFMVSLINDQKPDASYKDAGQSYAAYTGGRPIITAFAILAMSTPDVSNPVAVCMDVTVTATSGCTAEASIDNGSYDPDNTPITLTQVPPGPYPVGVTAVTLTVTDQDNATATCSGKVTVLDGAAPVPDAPVLPTLTDECSVTIVSVPTASDNCVSTVTGATTDPVSYTAQGVYTITWTYDDGNGNITAQTQDVVVDDVTAPVPDVATLPAVSGTSPVSVSTAPTATDACVGPVTGTTSDPLTYAASGSHTITWTYDDGNGNTSTQTQTVHVQTSQPTVVITGDDLVTLGYGTGTATLTATVTNGTPPYSFSWSTNQTGSPITVSPTVTTVYTVTVTDGNTQTASDQFVVTVLDWRCGSNQSKVAICHNGHTVCVSPEAVQAHRDHGDELGACQASKSGHGIPGAFSLAQNYPNPFNPNTTIEYGIPAQGNVRLRVFDLLGREVAMLVNETKQPGGYAVNFDGGNCPSGIYLYRLEWNGIVVMRRMTLLK